ncbi:MAG: acyl-[acyl-carrier-protein] thioesterase, partial [Pseudobdellovibrionaceae bacterium]
MKQQIWIERYKISSYLVNLRGRAGLYAVLNLIQDVGWMHANHWDVQLLSNQGWVFTRQKLKMQQWPAWNETVEIRTWLRPLASASSAFFLRDYELFVKDRKIGECTSTFAVMDMQTRKIVSLDWNQFSNMWRTEGQLQQTPSKISWSSQVEILAQFQVRNSDLDMNNHVNNTRYAQWILDSIPLDNLREGADLLGYEVNFLAETKSGDMI